MVRASFVVYIKYQNRGTCDLGDFGIVVGATPKLLIWNICAKQCLEFTQQKQKTFSEQQFCEYKCLVDNEGQGTMGRLV